MSEGKPATPGQAASLGEVYWIAARQRKIAQGGAAPSSWALLGADLRGICEAGAEAVAMQGRSARRQRRRQRRDA